MNEIVWNSNQNRPADVFHRVLCLAFGRSGLQDAWSKAVQQIAAPVLGAAAIISAGFGIFGLSTFPPTRRFGLAVIVGTLAAAALALLVLPRLAAHGLSPAALRKRMES